MFKKFIAFFLCISVMLMFNCSCSLNTLKSSEISNIISTESTSYEEKIVIAPTTSVKDMTSQEVTDLVEKEAVLIDLPSDFKFTSGEIQYIYNQYDKNIPDSSINSRQTIDFLLFGKLTNDEENKLVETLDTATWQNSGVQFEKIMSKSESYYKTLEDKRNRTNEQRIEHNGEPVLCYYRNISYTTIYQVHTSLGIFINIFKDENNNYNIIIEGQIENKNPVEGLLKIQPDGSAKVVK